MLDAVTLLFSQSFLIRALIVGVLISLCSALLGVSLVLKRFSMIGDGLSHVGFGAVVVPNLEHRPQQDVHLTVGLAIQVLGIEQKLDQLGIYLQRIAARLPVDGTQIVDARIFMVNIK